MNWIAIGAVSGLLAVALGAFGAHGLSQVLEAKSLDVFHTASQYQMYHALALLGVGLWDVQNPGHLWVNIAGWAFALGIVLFSGSLYGLALSGVRVLGIITPFGGISLMIGWAALAYSVIKK